MSTENSQFQPVYRLSLFREGGEGVIIEPPAQIDFDIRLTRVGHPNEAQIVIYNINNEMQARISSNEYGLIRLEAGYERANNMAVIFEGDIRRAAVKKLQNGNFNGQSTQVGIRQANDFVTTIIAGEGEISWRRVTIEHVFPSGTTFMEMAEFCIQHMPNITRGDLSGLEGREISAPYAVSGPLRRFFDDLATTSGSRWSMQRTSLDFISNERAKNTFTVNKKTFDTGLYEASVDESGVDAVIALDPALKPNGIVEIDAGEDAATGFWRINDVEHTGSMPEGGLWESRISGIRLEGVERVTGQAERAQFSG